jgi:cation:H+ antiporter
LSFSFLDSSPGPYVLGRIDGLVFLLLFSVFMYYTVTGAKRERKSAIRIPGDEKGNVRGFLTAMVLGIAGVIIGGEILVYTATGMAKSLGISEAVIGLTVVAAGTSLPELATNIMAALKKEGQIAIGNIIGSNIFNILLVLGVAAAISPMEVAASFVNFDMIVMILFSVLLSFFIFTGRRLSRKEGFALFAGFLSYLGCLFYLTFA